MSYSFHHGNSPHIFSVVASPLQDCIRVMCSGSAPLSPKVMTFFRCLLGVPVVEGYGQTEASAAATFSNLDDVASVGHVGGPHGSMEVVLKDVPEMGYLSTGE